MEEAIVQNTQKNKNKKFYFFIIILIVILILVVTYLIFFKVKNAEEPDKPIYQFLGNKFSYSQDRGNVLYNMTLRSDNNKITIYNISFYSRDFLGYKTKIYGLLFIPKNKTNMPGLVLLPGGNVKKESEILLASLIADEGYAVITIDQRGIGETGGYYLSFQDDFAVFLKGNEPIQHLSVYDALVCSDVLREIENVDKNNIAIAGESMGGRYAIIAAAIDNRLKGVLGISTSGFHVIYDGTNESKYLVSIDPDNYIKDISPNYVIMLHGGNDTMIPLNESKYTFSLAREPKKFYEFVKCGHGYCSDMNNEIKNSLKLIFGT